MASRLLFALFLNAGLLAGAALAADSETSGDATMKDVVVTAAPEQEGYNAPAATVSGKTPARRKDIPSSVSVLTRTQMDDQNMVTTWDALSQMTGVQAISNDSLQGQYRIRGASPDIRYDGSPSLYGLGGMQQFDLAMYESIEVQRGPTGVLQGSGSYGGVVNLVRKRPTSSFTSSVLGAFGSWNNKRLEADIAGPLTEAKNVRGRFVASRVDKDWFVNRFHDDKWLAYGALDVDLGSATMATFSVAHQEDEAPGYSGLPTYTNGKLIDFDRSFNPNPTWNKMIWKITEYATGLEHRFDNQWLGKVQLTRREASFFLHDAFLWDGIDPATNTSTYRRREWDYDYNSDDVDAYVSGPFDLFGRKHNLLVGANYSWFQSTGRGGNLTPNVTGVVLNDPPAVPDFTAVYSSGSQNVVWQQGLYSQARFSLADPLTLIVGARTSDYHSESRSVSPSVETGWAPGAKAKHHTTPFAGVVYDLTSKVSLYGSYADIFVPQTKQKADGSILEPVIGRQFELGSKGEFNEGKLNASFAVFNIEETNKAYADGTGFYLPLGTTETKGWEAEIVGRPLSNLDLSAGYTNLITRVTKSSTAGAEGTPVSYWYPRHQIKLWSTYRFGVGPLEGISAGFGMQGQSRVASGPSTATVQAREQGSFAVFSAQVGYKINKTYAVSLAANNLFDRSYFTRVQGTSTYMSYGEPRNFMLALRGQY